MEKEIKKEEWEVYWDHCKPILEPAVAYQQAYTIDDVEDKIRHGYFHLWPGKNSAMVAELINFRFSDIFFSEIIKNLFKGV